MGLPYVHENTPSPTPDLLSRVIGQFRAAGCNVR
jgi:pyruvate formate lyase activating enzyme